MICPTALVFLAVITLTSPASAARAASPVLRDTTYTVAADRGGDSLVVRELEFEHPVSTGVVSLGSDTLLVGLRWKVMESRGIASEPRDEGRLIAYDLSARRVLWDRAGTGVPIVARQDRALVWSDDSHADVIALGDGTVVDEVRGRVFPRDSRTVLAVTDGTIERIDLGGGLPSWRAQRTIGGPANRVVWGDSVAFLIADGLQRVDLRDGASWAHQARTRRADLYSASSGGTVQVRSLYGGSRAEGLASRPLVIGDDVYFAADTSVVCLNAATGDVRWRRDLPRPRGFSLGQRALGAPATPEFLGALLMRTTGPLLSVASRGWSSGPQHGWLADRPTLALIDRADGRVVARVQLPGGKSLADLWSDSLGHFAVMDDRILRLNDSLRVVESVDVPPDLQPLGQLVQSGDTLVAVCRTGVAAFTASPLRTAWVRRSGRLLSLERDLDESGGRWLATTQGLVRLHARGDRASSASFALRAAWAGFAEGGLMSGAGNSLRLIELPSPAKPAAGD